MTLEPSSVPGGESTLLYVLALLGCVAALAWVGLGGPARMAPRAAWRFALANVLAAGSALLMSGRGDALSYATYPLANLLGIASLAFVREGGQRLMHIPVRSRQTWWVPAVSALVMFSQEPGPASLPTFAIVFSTAVALIAIQGGRSLRHTRPAEFPAAAVHAIAVVLMLFGAAMLARALAIATGLPLATRYAGHSSMTSFIMLVVFVVMLIGVNVMLMALLLMRLFARVRRLATRDALTGVLNRRALRDLIDEQLALQRRHGDGFAIVMFDLDHFKDINDRLGHSAGDAALGFASRAVAATLRDGDSLGRYGGEEFVVVLTRTDLSGALAAAERMRSALQATPFVWNGQPVAILASFGVCTAAAAMVDFDTLMRRADEAMYRAKSLGRNRVEAAPAASPLHEPR